MTRMSASRRARIAEPIESGHPTGVARALHTPRGVRYVVLAAVGGCVIPPSLSVENQDAGQDSPPAIVSVRSDLQELSPPGPVTFAVGTGTAQLTLLDTDLGDDLEARFFVDYAPTNTTAPRAICKAPANGTATRTTTCDLGGLCIKSDLDTTRDLTIVVFDREVLDAGTPRYQAMAPGGLSTSVYFHLVCVPQS